MSTRVEQLEQRVEKLEETVSGMKTILDHFLANMVFVEYEDDEEEPTH